MPIHSVEQISGENHERPESFQTLCPGARVLGGTRRRRPALPLTVIPAAARAAQAAYPSRNFRVVIPTGQGGGAEKLARAFDAAWSKLLGQPFEYEFFPGAAGQVGYTLYVQKRDRNGHNLLFGNMGPEMIMYATQKPAYKFPQDFIYFCRTDIDDFVRVRAPRLAVQGHQVAGRGGEEAGPSMSR